MTDEEKGKIEALTTANWSQRRIAQEIGRDKKTVLNYQRHLKSPKPKAKLVRKSKLTTRMMGSLIIKARTGKFSSRELVGLIKADFNIEIDIRRMQQIISNAPYMKYLKKLKPPKMTSGNIKNRVK